MRALKTRKVYRLRVFHWERSKSANMGVGASQCCHLKIICDIAITLLYLQGNWPKERQPKEFEMYSRVQVFTGTQMHPLAGRKSWLPPAEARLRWNSLRSRSKAERLPRGRWGRGGGEASWWLREVGAEEAAWFGASCANLGLAEPSGGVPGRGAHCP